LAADLGPAIIESILYRRSATLPKTAKAEPKKGDQLTPEEMKSFIENTAKQGTPRNGRRIEFHFVRRKRKAC